MTKIDIISGFLGAGKTTFIKKMLEEVFQGEKIVLIENEFGEVGIDGGFLKDSGITISELNSGCICCSLVGDFGKNLRQVIEQFHPDRILIEPSGVGKLSDVMKSVREVEEEQDVLLGACITVVNTLKATKQMRAFGEFFNNQIEYATSIVLSRTQKSTPEQVELVVAALREKNAKATILTTSWEEMAGEQIRHMLEAEKTMEEELLAEMKEHHHGHCCHDHEEEHEHHHGHCCHDHEEEHEHHHHGHCCHEHEEEHEHHDHDHHDHDHGPDCTCGCHDHDHEHHHDHDHHHHHGHHHADEVFTSWGVETPHVFERETIEKAMKAFCETEDYGIILRAKGMVPASDGTWIYFDMVDGEYELRVGQPDYTGRLCVIGSMIHEESLAKLFGLA